jgi:hypothetical protein
LPRRRDVGRVGGVRVFLSLLATAACGVIAWFAFGQGILEGVDAGNARSAGGGPQAERMVAARRFGAVVGELREEIGPRGPISAVTLRALSAEVVTRDALGVVGYRWRDRRGKLVGPERFAPTPPATASFAMRRIVPRAPGRIAAAITRAEGDEFLLSLGTLERAGSGRLVWVLRGRIGERGVAYSARPDGKRVARYDPSSAELSRGAALSRCLRGVARNPERARRCLQRAGG